MFRLLLIAGAAGGLFVAVPATAAPATAAPAAKHVDGDALKAADRLLTAMGYDRMLERTYHAMVAQIGPMLKSSIETRTGKSVDDALVQRLTEIQSDFMRETLLNSPNLRRATATLYATHFTALELDRLAELYKDPVMRKWSEVTPDLSAQLLPLIHGVMESRRADLEQRIKAAVLDYYAEKGQSPTS